MSKEEIIEEFRKAEINFDSGKTDYIDDTFTPVLDLVYRLVNKTISDEKLYTVKQMKSYAEHSMVKLLTKYPNGEDDMGEISILDLHRIKKVLNNKDAK
tara:strand:+ start:551 stop:847 length:297 start_codon:yes stop_codon:yes gene_type:complete